MTAKAPIPLNQFDRLGSASATGPNGRIYVAGGGWPARLDFCPPGWLRAPDGQWGTNTNVVYSYDPLADTWFGENAMNMARAGHALATGIDGKIYAFGGDSTGTIECFDVETQGWSLVDVLPSAPAIGPYNFAVTTDRDGDFYLMGGDDGHSGAPSNAVYRWQWNPTSHQYATWNSTPPMSTGRKGHKALTALDGKIYLACEDGQIEYLNPGIDLQWTVLNGATTPGFGFGAVAASNDTFFLAGGRRAYGAGFSPGSNGLLSKSPGALTWEWVDPATSLWPGPHLSGLKSFLSLATAEGEIFSLGGAQKDDPCVASSHWYWRDDVESYGTFAAKMLPGLTSLWRFDDSSLGTATFDSINPLQYANFFGVGTLLTDGRVKNGLPLGKGAVAFGGGSPFSGFLAVTSDDIRNPNLGSGSFTLECWVKAPHSATRKTILDKRSGPETHPLGYVLSLGPNNRLCFQIANGTNWLNYEADGSFPSDAWTHCAVVVERPMSGASSVSLYVNGAQVKHYGSALAGDLENSALALIGCHHYDGTIFQGALDELSIYNRALNWLEVRSVFLAGKAGKR